MNDDFIVYVKSNLVDASTVQIDLSESPQEQEPPAEIINTRGLFNSTVNFDLKLTPNQWKTLHAQVQGYARPSSINRKRKRQIERAKFMDKSGYEYSQDWRKQYGKFRRNATRYSKRHKEEN